MNKYYLSILLLIIATTRLQAQKLNVGWTRFIGGENCYANVYDATITTDHGVIITGYTPCRGVTDMPSCSYTAYNVVLAKVDSTGQLNWVKLLGGSGNDAAHSICRTADSGYAILAYTESNDGDIPLSGTKGSTDLWLIKIDTAGNVLWSKTYGSPASENSIAVAVTPDNGFMLFGASNGYGDDIPFHHGTSQFENDWFVIKTDSIGNKQWVKVYGGSGDEDIFGSVLVANNAYYLISSSDSKDYDCDDTSWHKPLVNTDYDIYVVKIDTLGNIIWSKSYGGSNFEAAYKAIWDERDSSIVICGLSSSSDYMVNGGHGDNDMLVIKVDKNGDFLWSKMLGGAKNEKFSKIAKVNNYYAAYTSTLSTSIGRDDTWLFILDSAGNEVTSKVIGGTSFDEQVQILSIESDLFLAGSSSSKYFTEGYTVGHEGPGAFVSRLYYFPTEITGVKENEQLFMVYPNPGTSSVNIVNSTKQAIDLRVVDMTGNIMLHKNISGDKEMINISNWPKGVYLLHGILQDGTTCTSRFVHE